MTHFEHFNFYPYSSKTTFPPTPKTKKKQQDHTLRNTKTLRAMVDYSKWDKLTKESGRKNAQTVQTGEMR